LGKAGSRGHAELVLIWKLRVAIVGRVWKAHEIQYIEHVVVWEWIGVEEMIDQRFDWDFDNC
jgi:drug/metabolite transporter superfamily protein YnfA